MPNTATWTPSERVRVLVFGESKTGKTAGALTFPRPNIIDLDGGIAVARNPEFVKKYGLLNVEYEQFHEKNVNSKGVVTQHNAFDDATKYFDAWMKPGGAKWKASDGSTTDCHPDKFDTWVIDSGTSLSELAMNKAIVLLGSKALSMSSMTHAQAINTGLVYPKQQDFGSERSMVEQFIQMVKDTDKHLVLICHEKVQQDDGGTITGIVPLLTGKGVEAVCLKFDEIWNLKVKKKGTETVRELTTHKTPILKCGTRYGIPDGLAWEWPAVKGELDRIHSEQQAMLATQPASAPLTPAENK